MRFHLFIVFITYKFRASKKLMEIWGASLGLKIQAGGGATDKEIRAGEG